MASKFIPLLSVLSVAVNAAMVDYTQLNNRLQKHQQKQQQLNYEMQLEHTRFQDLLNQQHLEEEQRHYLDSQRQIQLYQEMQQQQNNHLQFINQQSQNQNQQFSFLDGNRHLFIQHPTSTSSQYFVRDWRAKEQPLYQFAYAVNDDFTGDKKTHHERRNGDYVEGQYTMMEADGNQRIVDYRADDVNGFQTEVYRGPNKVSTQFMVQHNNKNNNNNNKDQHAVASTTTTADDTKRFGY